MKKRILFVFLALVLVVSLAAFAACAKEEEAPPVEEEAPPVEEEWQWPEKLVVLTMGPASMDYAVNIGWTTPLAKDTGMKVRLITGDPSLKPLWLRQHLIDIAAAGFGVDTDQAAELEASGREGGPLQDRIIWAMGKGVGGFAVRGDSDIKTPYDIKPGMKAIYLKPWAEFFQTRIKALCAWAQVDPEDIVWVPAGSLTATGTLLIEGRGDISVGFPHSPVWLEVEAAPHGLAWIELNAEEDPEGAARFFEVDPSACFGVMTIGCPSALGVRSMITISYWTTHFDHDPELIYHLAKWLDENYDRIKDAHPYLKDATIENVMKLAEVEFHPLHDGTVKYLEEKGLWTPAHEARRQQNIDLITTYEEAFARCVDMADEKGITVDPENEEWLEMWENYKVELNLPRFRLFVTFP